MVKRFLVTGATGFIGNAVIRALRNDGHDVTAIGSADLDLLTASGGQLADLAGGAGATHCLHCAWYTNHADYLINPVNRDWLAASLRLADACRGIRFVGLGTCLEYDLALARPCVEDMTPLAPETLYACCKRDLFEALDGDVAWARVFFVYGPGDRAGRLVPAMVARFARGEQAGPTFGGLRRDYIHVDDLAAQIINIALANVRGAINTGTGEAPSLSDIYAAGAAAFSRPELALDNAEFGSQPPLIQADMTRFRRTVGGPPPRTVEEGLRDLVA